MSEFITEVAAKSGINVEEAKKALGVLLTFLKGKFPADLFTKVESAVPDANGLINAAKDVKEQSGGVLGAISESLGKLFGGNAAALASKLTHTGLTPDQMHKFFETVFALLQNKLPPDALKQLAGLFHLGDKVVKV
jgi:hypothetical protein